MMRSFFTGVTGLRSNQVAVDTISNNIANVNTNGFKSSNVFFQDFFYNNIGESSDLSFQTQVGLGTKIGAIQVNFSNGALQFTGRELDFALEGDGYFVIGDMNADYTTGIDSNNFDYDLAALNDRSELKYTRDGIFQWNNEGYLVTVGGHYVMKETTPGSGILQRINEVDDDNLSDVISLATFPNNNGLEKVGENFWMEKTMSGTPEIGQSNGLNMPVIRTQVVETSNVDLGLEFSRLIIASRAYQANSRSITTSDEMLQELLSIKR